MRIGVNIPNELMRRLEPLKPELNISQVCREALEAKAQNHEQMLARLEDETIQQAVSEVWEQEKELLAAIEFDWEMLGYEDAQAWVEAAGWDEWEDLRAQLDRDKELNWPEWDFIPPVIGGVKLFPNRTGELHQRMEEARKQNPRFYIWLLRRRNETDYKANQREYMTAWLKYTKAVWELIKQRELEHLERQLAQRAAPPEPEVPEHLFGDVQSRQEQPFQVVPHHAGYAPGVDPLKLNHLIGDLDVAEFLAERERPQ